ncbi:hypothetical protein DVH05_006359 [Phytophthora capsici]|nr:hypothetical protein DVH05_006359 [Phytophthora capsici]
MLNLLCEDPLVYTRAPLFSIEGSIVQGRCQDSVELWCHNVYVSRGFVKKHELKTQAYTDRTIKVKLGDNKIGESILDPVNGSGLHDAVDCKHPSAISRDSCRAAVPETRLEGEVESVERPAEDVEKLSKREKKNARAEAMFTLGVVDSEGIETKYITRKKLRKFLRLPAKDQPEHDFMIVC